MGFCAMRRLFYHPISIIICTVLVGILYYSLEKNANTAQISTQTLQELESQTVKMQAEVANLQTELEDSASTSAQERIARNQLLLQKPGEYIIQMPEIASEKTPTATPQPTLSPWQEWQKIIF